MKKLSVKEIERLRLLFEFSGTDKEFLEFLKHNKKQSFLDKIVKKI